MRRVKRFEEYLADRIARKQTPDLARANSLIEEAEESYAVLKSYLEGAEITEKNANYVIKNAYDIIMELVRSKMFLDGYNTSGHGAHEAEVSYLRKLGFSDVDVEFADKLRYFRNGILYYGKKYDREFALKVLDFLERLYPLMKK